MLRVLLVLLVLGCLAVPAQAAAPRCLGAASRDPAKRCVNAQLKTSVTPTPRRAPVIPGTPCTQEAAQGLAVPCAFGAPEGVARGRVALIGDSHAAHWRPAIDALTKTRKWWAVALTRSGCALSAVPRTLPTPLDSQCETWKSDVLTYLTNHPEIDTVFLAQKVLDADDFAPKPLPLFGELATGFVNEWNQLPASVRHVYVIRDNPSARVSTLGCVTRAIKRRQDAGRRCAVPRSFALPPDPAQSAAGQLPSSRFKLIDLTPFFCDTRSCYPVVGGVLVYRDVNHLTTLFAQTLAPYLARGLGT